MDLLKRAVRERVIGLVEMALDVSRDPIKDETRLIEDLGADSLDVAVIEMDIEDEFDIEVSGDEYGKTGPTVGHLVKLVEEKLRGRSEDEDS